MNKWEIISFVFNPFIFASIIFFILVYLYLPTLTFNQIVLITFVCVLFATTLPLIYIFVFITEERKINHIDIDYDISNKKYRIKPSVVATISYFFGFLILFYLNSPLLIKGLMFCYLVNALIITFITLFWKISIHTAGITGTLTILIYKLGVLFLPLYLIVLPVGLARIKLKKHTFAQVCAGAILTMLSTWLLLLLIIIPLF